MSKIVIEGKNPLSGVIQISGAKNSVVALIPAAIMTKEKVTIYNVPNIRDIEYLIKILEYLECQVKWEDGTITINAAGCVNKPIPEELSIEMRASYYFIGALLARFGSAEISYPGGCKFVSRPIDMHINGFKALGANVEETNDRIIINSSALKGTKIDLPYPSVGATINIMLAAVGAKGNTVINNAAKEPEIENIANLLINLGADIEGVGTSQIVIHKAGKLTGGQITVIPDRIEACTYITIGALLGQHLIINGIIEKNIEAFLIKLKETGATYELHNDSIIINANPHIKPIELTTDVFPGFPTDAQQVFTAYLTQADGKSTITETVFQTRFKNAEYLNLMGANTNDDNNKLYINGPTKLKGTDVTATDLRAGACLVIAGLIAEGTTTIDNIYHILRGYENIIEKLVKVGAKIKITE